MPTINCDCVSLKVCAHRGEIEKAWQRVLEIGSPKWKEITRFMNESCPYKKSDTKMFTDYLEGAFSNNLKETDIVINGGDIRNVLHDTIIETEYVFGEREISNT